MTVWVLGDGGREHALVWALRQSRRVERILVSTENAGMVAMAEVVRATGGEGETLVDLAVREGVDLVVIGPEQPLVDGIADQLEAKGIAVFGPSQAAARLEGSKVFAKEFMLRHGIPTAACRIVSSAEEAREVVRSGLFGYPLVLKAEGLAAGKGVILAADETEALDAVQSLMVDRTLGSAGDRLLLEECLRGREISYLVLSDGTDFLPLPVAQDHKRAFDGDEGPNTGGMGAYSTPELLDPVLEAVIQTTIVAPSLAGARAEGFPFRGVLYCGLMLTAAGPKVLEYNVRFGDPETQAILRRLESDFAELALAVAVGQLGTVVPRWSDEVSTCIVLASGGYPGTYEKGKPITGLAEAATLPGIVLFHAGTSHSADGQSILTSGGRVLGVTARATTLAEATTLAYRAVKAIQFDGMQYRHDIGFASGDGSSL
ncbi:MAG: phosphoribosylamine--glycine ligase [Blastocatellia bacterium]